MILGTQNKRKKVQITHSLFLILHPPKVSDYINALINVFHKRFSDFSGNHRIRQVCKFYFIYVFVCFNSGGL